MSKTLAVTEAILNKTCRNNIYPKSEIKRFPVPDKYVQWCIPYTSYAPVSYTAAHISGQVWADPDIGALNFNPKWNQIGGNVNRVSFNGLYQIDNGYPLNPIGRTGLRGRGILGRWGPNHAADPIVTRWKRDASGNIIKHKESGKYVWKTIPTLIDRLLFNFSYSFRLNYL